MRFSANGQKKKQLFFIVVVCALLCILPVSAMSLSSTKYTGTIAAGETITYPITIGLGSNEKSTNFTLEVLGFGQNMEKGYTPLDSSSVYKSLFCTPIYIPRQNPDSTQPGNLATGHRNYVTSQKRWGWWEICDYLYLCSPLKGAIGNDCCDHPCFYHNFRNKTQPSGNCNQRQCRGDDGWPADYGYYYVEKYWKLSLFPVRLIRLQLLMRPGIVSLTVQR